ncbi:hypothetical protein ACWDSJ_27985 [Nocardia sp. NPDC003482]
MKRAVRAVVLVAALAMSGTGAALAQPPATTPVPSGQVSPQSPGGAGPGEQIPIRQPATGGVQWDRFGGDGTNAPHDLDSFITDVIGWLRTLALVCAMAGALITAALLIAGVRGRSDQAKRALERFPTVLAATVMAGSAYTIIMIFL